MNMNQKTLSVVVIVVLLGAVGYFVFVRKSTPIAQQTATPTSTPKDETANWKTYTNTEYGLEFKYPVGMTLGGFEKVEFPKLFTFFIDYKADNKDLPFAVYPVTIYENIAEYRKNRQSTTVTLGRQAWYRFDVHSTVDYVQYYLERGGNLYRVDIYDSKNEDELKQILSSFKFTK